MLLEKSKHNHTLQSSLNIEIVKKIFKYQKVKSEPRKIKINLISNRSIINRYAASSGPDHPTEPVPGGADPHTPSPSPRSSSEAPPRPPLHLHRLANKTEYCRCHTNQLEVLTSNLLL
ncbi:unnamed protein product [Pieris brassicae]|uniref:Uncharacterized protein n=1 Tax=Pieris brassicae TaxID=7116 RepID=A0A9P0TNM4_PIEBR|nr:unnamed protein product [Pieris brassicae]